MRVAIVYDCLYPHTIGGAERCYRDLAERLAARGHAVTYVTRRQWAATEQPMAPAGVAVVCVAAGGGLYAPSGRRRVAAPLLFGWGVLLHLLAHRRDYDVVQVCSFPYFPLLAARLVRALGGPPLLADWYEVWTRDYWRAYLGPLAGRFGCAIEQLCIRASGDAVVFSQLHAGRLRGRGCRGRLHLLRGGYWTEKALGDAGPRRPLVVYVGRHIAEKNVIAIPAAVALARRDIPDLRAVIFGDGPTRPAVLAEIERFALSDVVACPGFAPWQEVDAALREGLCLLLPSTREGYGLAIIEAAARGLPSVVTSAPDSAAPELIEDGRNGRIVPDASPESLAAAIVASYRRRDQLHASTRAWFAEFASARDPAAIEQIYRKLTRASPRGPRGRC